MFSIIVLTISHIFHFSHLHPCTYIVAIEMVYTDNDATLTIMWLMLYIRKEHQGLPVPQIKCQLLGIIQ